MKRHRKWVEAMRSAVLGSQGTVEPAVREAASRNDGVPEVLRSYVDKVARHAYRVTDEDVDALKQAGYTEDQLFEITVSAAVGAGLHRLEAGLAALEAGGA
jgi:alkylhydroperoxidase family enzyme